MLVDPIIVRWGCGTAPNPFGKFRNAALKKLQLIIRS